MLFYKLMDYIFSILSQRQTNSYTEISYGLGFVLGSLSVSFIWLSNPFLVTNIYLQEVIIPSSFRLFLNCFLSPKPTFSPYLLQNSYASFTSSNSKPIFGFQSPFSSVMFSILIQKEKNTLNISLIINY